MEYIKTNELEHHGILGMKWGVRRFQNEDGSLKPAGKKRYANRYERAAASLERDKADFEKYKDTGILNKKGKILVSKEEVGQTIDALQKQIDKNVEKSNEVETRKFNNNVNTNWWKAYNKANEPFNANINAINEKYKDSDFRNGFATKEGIKYLNEVNDLWTTSYTKALSDMFGKHPVEKSMDWVKNAPFMDTYYSEIAYAEKQYADKNKN